MLVVAGSVEHKLVYGKVALELACDVIAKEPSHQRVLVFEVIVEGLAILACLLNDLSDRNLVRMLRRRKLYECRGKA